ncbi:FAD:protein FMN transferase [Dendrosporobacter sp. 1207_IL3150]|uniref:FAD:protein FMN transferase n=1 Tax=Dendrosporobacter sp. 1207_IL3150 TaxID=3084054 RepID=UPI002FD9CC74
MRHLANNSYIVIMIFVTIIVTGCFSQKQYKETRFMMDTIVEVTAYGPNSEQAVKAAFNEFQRIHDLANSFDEESTISNINKSAGIKPVNADPEIIYMIKRANSMSDKLDGVFDVTIGSLSHLWGIGKKGEYVPALGEVSAILQKVNYQLIEINETQNSVFLPKSGMMLDLGGIAKGYAVDKALEILKQNGITSALINAGGDVRVIGKKPDGQPWRIGVQHPRNSEGISAKLALTEWDTMETSGDYQRYLIKDGVRYSHILDPRTGYQPRQLASVTIVNNNSGDGDILSTAVFILGAERGIELLKQFPGNEAIIVTAEGKTIVTPGLEGRVELSVN